MYKSSDEIIEILNPIIDFISIERYYTGRWKIVMVDNKTLSKWIGYGKTLPEALIDTIAFINKNSEFINFNLKQFEK